MSRPTNGSAASPARDARPAEPPTAPPQDDASLEAFAAMLRAFGQYAFDLEHEGAISFNQQCEAWARHLLVLAPPPIGDADGIVAEDAPELADGERDWASVLHFVRSRRQREQQHVNQALGELRQGIWSFAQSLGTALVEDQRMDNRMKSQIDRLKVALERPSMLDFTKEVTAAANTLSRLVTERQQAQRQRLEELGARVTDLAGQLREAKQENIRDGLTQLVNRKGFDEFMNRMVFMRDVFGESAVLLIIDADRFKAINDRYGHPGGDAVLKGLADCLVRNFPRKSDLVARYGGEEFAVVLPDTSIPNAVRLADRTRQAVRDLNIDYAGQTITVAISVGVAQLGRHESVQSWIERADQALYFAKSQGRDRVVSAIDAD
ncbi:MAG: diguanylate cyclase [Gemmataceae bacterium]|nr:diguanylate cyclase [Gemmataceae bacterium]